MISRQVPARRFRCFLTELCTSSVLVAVLLTASQAQMVRTTITSDNTLGTTVIRQGQGRVYDITGGTRPGVNGPNLFHSFDRFNVGTGDTARFSGPAGIVNILSRVTGRQRSEIDGCLQSTIPGADLYLLNPSGVVFGPNATLDVSGSFHVSTADYLRLADDTRFMAQLGAQSTLTVASPTAFGFLSGSPARIAVRDSRLQVLPGHSLSVVGGNLAIQRNPVPFIPTLRAPGGQIRVVSAAAAGEVALSPGKPSTPPGSGAVTRRGTITITGGWLDANGTRSGTIQIQGGRVHVQDGAFITAQAAGSGRAGRVIVQSDALTITERSLISASTPSGTAGRIVIQTDKLRVTDNSRMGVSGPTGGSIRIQGQMPHSHVHSMLVSGSANISAQTIGRGTAGQVVIHADRLTVREGAQISTTALPESSGAAGQVIINAGILTLRGADSGITSTSQGTGAGGDILIRAGQMQVFVNAVVSADVAANARANGGLIRIRADTLFVEDSRIANATQGRGDAGDVDIAVQRLVVTNGGLIDVAQSEAGRGDGGEIRIKATEMFVGGLNSNMNPSRVTSRTTGRGDAGRIVLRVDRLMLAAEGRISTNTISSGNAGTVRLSAGTVTIAGGEMLSETSGSGQAGRIDITADRLVVTDSGQISSSTSREGRGGSITVTATDAITLVGQGSGLSSNTAGGRRGGDIRLRAPMVQLTDQASISARSDGIGNAGDIRISGTDTLLLSSGSTVTTAASQASGGRITIVARTLLRLHDSAITASVQGGRDTVGGNITIDPEFVVLQNSQITANANEGQGGRIQLTAGVFLADPASSVTASSERGIDGEVNIQAPVSNLSGALRPLPPDFATATALFRDRCVARRREGTISTLVERGRDGVPAAPHGALPSRFPDWHPRSASTGVLPPSSHKTRLLRQSELQRDAAGQVRVSGWPAPIGVARLWTQECVNR